MVTGKMISQERLEHIVKKAKKKMRPFVEGAIVLATGAFIGYISKEDDISLYLAIGGISTYTTLEATVRTFRKKEVQEKIEEVRHTLYRHYMTLGSAGVVYYFYS